MCTIMGFRASQRTSGPSDPSSTLGSSSSSSGGPAPALMQFTVFDVFFHVRILEVLLPATRMSILRVIRAHTPQLGSSFGHRVVCRPLAGFPEPQFVVWEEPSEHSRVFPILHPDVDHAVCTIEAPHSTCVFQIAVLIEQACGTLPDYRHAIARQIAHITLDDTSFPPFVSCDTSRVDAASFGWGPPGSGGIAAARWAHPWPRHLPLSRPHHFSDAAPSDLVMVHRLERVPLLCRVDGHLRFGQACTALHEQLGTISGYFRLPQFCPATPGIPLHLVLDDRKERSSRTLGIIDLRHMCGPGVPEFLTVVCPRKFGLEWLRQYLFKLGHTSLVVREAFVDGARLREPVDAVWPAILISCVGSIPLLPGSGPLLLPAVLDTRDIMNARIGLAQSSMKCRHAPTSPLSVRGIWPSAVTACCALGPDPGVNFDLPAVFSFDCYPAPDDFELVVYSLHEAAFRTWIPRLASYDEVVCFLAGLCGVTEACALWPDFAPCIHGEVGHVVIVPEVLRSDRFAIVDSRRLFPSDARSALRLVMLPDRVAAAHVRTDLLKDMQTRRVPGWLAVNGLPLRGTLVAHPGVRVVTIFPPEASLTSCVYNNIGVVREHIGCRLGLQALSTTTTTCGVLESCLGFPTTSTTSSPGSVPMPVRPIAPPQGTAVRLVFALPGTRCRSVIWHTGQPLALALWPLVSHFAQHLPWDTGPTLVAAHRFTRDEVGRPILLLTAEHPDFVCSCNTWIYVQDAAIFALSPLIGALLPFLSGVHIVPRICHGIFSLTVSELLIHRVGMMLRLSLSPLTGDVLLRNLWRPFLQMRLTCIFCNFRWRSLAALVKLPPLRPRDATSTGILRISSVILQLTMATFRMLAMSASLCLSMVCVGSVWFISSPPACPCCAR